MPDTTISVFVPLADTFFVPYDCASFYLIRYFIVKLSCMLEMSCMHELYFHAYLKWLLCAIWLSLMINFRRVVLHLRTTATWTHKFRSGRGFGMFPLISISIICLPFVKEHSSMIECTWSVKISFETSSYGQNYYRIVILIANSLPFDQVPVVDYLP